MNLMQIIYLTLICLSVALGFYSGVYYTIDLVSRHKGNKLPKAEHKKAKRIKEINATRVLIYDETKRVIKDFNVTKKCNLKKEIKKAFKELPSADSYETAKIKIKM